MHDDAVERPCPSCGAEVIGGAAACPRCGEPLLQPERKLVTLLFADLSGYSAIASSLDPEAVFAVVRPWMTALRLVVEAHGGTVPQVMGDGFMALFGVPTAHEDDAERAVRAAFALIREADALAGGGSAIAFPGLHVGVNTGEVMVVGSREASGFGVVGDAVNVTARLADRAGRGEILVGATTRALTIGAIRYAARLEVELKGMPRAIGVYRAVAPRDATRAASSHRHALAPPPFVGRAAVIRRLLGTARDAERRGTATVLAVIDEPGVGKTRLARELAVRLPSARVLVGACQPYGQRLPLAALADAVSSALGLVPGSPPSRLQATIQRALRAAVEIETTPALGAQIETLLGGTDASRAPAGRTSRGDATSSLEARAAVRPVLHAIGSGRLLVVVIDDVHWADPELVGLLADLARDPWPEPMLFLALGRPEPGDWHAALPKLRLGGLPRSEGRRFLRALLGAPAPETLVDRLVGRAAGNPLFLEESARMLIERGALSRDRRGWRVTDPAAVEAVPPSLRLLVAARLDALPQDEKRALQDASITGEVTWDDLILELARDRVARSGERAVRDAIGGLQARDLLRPRPTSSVSGAIELESKHAVIRDVAYESLPLAERSARHRIAGDWLRTHIGDAGVGSVAYQYLRAWELARSQVLAPNDPELARLAARHLRLWADVVLVFQPRLAESIYGQALAIADAEPAAIERELIVALLVGRAESLSELGRHAEAIMAADAARGMVGDVDGQLGYVLLALGRARSDLGQVAVARELIERALERFRSAGDVFGQARALHRLAEACRFDDLATEIECYREAFRLYRAAGSRAHAAAVADDLAYLLTITGGSESERWLKRARRMAERGGSERGVAALSRAVAYSRWYRGDLDGALRAALEARRPAAQAGDRWLEVDTLLIEALVRSAAGPPSEAERLVRELLRIADAVGARHLRALALLAGARPALRAGRPVLASRRLGSARRTLLDLGVAMELAEADLAAAGVELERGRWDLAAELASAAERRSRANGWRLLIPACRLVRARAHLGAGRLSECRRELGRSRRLASALDASGPLAVAEALGRQVDLLDPLAPLAPASADHPAIDGEGSGLSSFEPRVIDIENEALTELARAPSVAAGGFARASRSWGSMGTTVWRARAELLRGLALEASGDARRARLARRRSVALLEAIGAPSDALEGTLRCWRARAGSVGSGEDDGERRLGTMDPTIDRGGRTGGRR